MDGVKIDGMEKVVDILDSVLLLCCYCAAIVGTPNPGQKTVFLVLGPGPNEGVKASHPKKSSAHAQINKYT